MFINWLINEQAVMPPFNRILLNNNITGTQDNTDESPKHYAKCKNPDSESQALYDISLIQLSGKGKITAT